MIGIKFALKRFLKNVKSVFITILQWLIGLPGRFWSWIKRYRKPIIATLLVIVTAFSVWQGSAFVVHLIRRPQIAEGNLFDKDVMQLFWLENLQKPQGVVSEDFSCKIEKDRKLFDKRGTYEYVCYTEHSLVDTYALYVQSFLLQHNKEKYTMATPRYGVPSLYYNPLSFTILTTELCGVILYDGREKYELKEGDVLESVTYEVCYSDVFGKVWDDIFFCDCLRYARDLKVQCSNIANENGYYKTTITARLSQSAKLSIKFE